MFKKRTLLPTQTLKRHLFLTLDKLRGSSLSAVHAQNGRLRWLILRMPGWDLKALPRG